MSEPMDQKTIDTVDQLVNGYHKVKTLYQDNKVMVSNLKLWFQKNKTQIIIGAIVLAVIAVFAYKQYQQFTEESLLPEKKPAQTKKASKTIEVTPDGAAEVIPED